MTAQEICGALDGWIERREPFDLVETGIAALDILKALRPSALAPQLALQNTIRALDAWLENEDPAMPEDLCVAILHWVRQSQEKTT